MYLTIVRHAAAEDRDATRWPDDRGRPLTEQGVARFRKAAAGLVKLAGTPDVVFTSPLQRTVETAAILHQAGWPAAGLAAELEPSRSPSDAARLLADVTPGAMVAVIGHEPNVSELLAYLLFGQEARSATVFKKGGAARVDIDGEVRAGSGTLRWLVGPRMLRALE